MNGEDRCIISIIKSLLRLPTSLRLMRCIAKEVAPRGIRVNTVNPGPIDNEFTRTAEKSMTKMLGRDAGEMFDQIMPMGRHGQPEEVARISRPVQRTGIISSRPILGGLHHHYVRV